MSERKVNLEEILEKHRQMFIENSINPNYIMDAMKEACRQVLELAAENAKLSYVRILVDDPKEGDEAYRNFSIVDKQSIVNMINRVG